MKKAQIILVTLSAIGGGWVLTHWRSDYYPSGPDGAEVANRVAPRDTDPVDDFEHQNAEMGDPKLHRQGREEANARNAVARERVSISTQELLRLVQQGEIKLSSLSDEESGRLLEFRVKAAAVRLPETTRLRQIERLSAFNIADSSSIVLTGRQKEAAELMILEARAQIEADAELLMDEVESILPSLVDRIMAGEQIPTVAENDSSREGFRFSRSITSKAGPISIEFDSRDHPSAQLIYERILRTRSQVQADIVALVPD